MKFETPYDDENLIFDQDMYVLTLTAVKKEFDNPFNDDGILEKRLKKNSRKIYNYIHHRGHSKNRFVVDKLLNHTKEGREFIFKVLMAEIEADLESGYNDTSIIPSVNSSNGQIIERNELRRNQICIDAEQLIEDSSSIFGVNLVYQGIYPQLIFWKVLNASI